MMKGSKSGCKSASHQLFKDKAKNRVDDLQGVFTDLQFARKESRVGDVAVLEEQVHQMLREWKAELNEPSPASSLLGGSHGSFSTDLCRFLQRCDEEDDATSVLAEPTNPKPEPDVQSLPTGDTTVFHGSYFVNQASQEHGFQGVNHCKENPSEMQPSLMNNLDMANHFDFHQFDLHDFNQNLCVGLDGTVQCGEDVLHHISDLLPPMYLPPSAFLGPICALWDCPRPAQGGSLWYQNYCSPYHATLATSEGPPGMSPVLRPGGIGLKDGPLFAALGAKTQGKDVGIPECEGAATTKSPWNASDLFDLSLLEGETIREWLFFDKPRRAFESGNRKQRSLPDYSGRGWHESRKQVMKEFGGLKRSYYMDPQPLNHYEWHLYEYEINNCDACALYRLEFKQVDGKKSPKGKLSDPLLDLQKQMGRLTAEFPADNKRSVKGRTKVNSKDGAAGNVYSAPDQMGANENLGYAVNAPYGYTVESLNDYYGT